MSILLTEALAHGGPGAWHSDYKYYAWFADYATAIANLLGNARTCLLAGCGYGYDVDALRLVAPGTVSVWGCDASQYAVDQAHARLPAASAARVVLGDALSATSMTSVRAAAGITGNRRFDVLVTSDLLTTCVSDAEVQTMLTVLRATGQTLAHVLTILADDRQTSSDGGIPVGTWLRHTLAEWRALINAPTERIFDYGRMLLT